MPIDNQAEGEIKRLRVQLKLADDILSSDLIMRLINGDNHPSQQRDSLRSDIISYWESYGRNS